MVCPTGAEVELEPEVETWIRSLTKRERGQVAFHIDRLAETGPLLDEPYTRQLDGKLRELRFYLGDNMIRISYWMAPAQRIVLLTVFPKLRPRESREVARAKRAMEKCIRENHTADEGNEYDHEVE